MYLDIKLLDGKAKLPSRASQFDAGYDLHAAEDSTVPAHDRVLVSTGLAMTVPDGHYGRIAPRSGLAVKYGISIGAGVVDSGYTGEVKVLMFNHSKSEFKLSTGDRIAQLIIERISLPEVRAVLELNPTERGEKGFGSSGR